MKPLRIFLLIVMFISFSFLIYLWYSNHNVSKHICIDETHRDCDGACSCDGVECLNSVIYKAQLYNDSVYKCHISEMNAHIQSQKAIQYVNAYDYQLDISTIPDSIIIMDGRRYVGTIPMWDNSPLDSLLKADNE